MALTQWYTAITSQIMLISQNMEDSAMDVLLSLMKFTCPTLVSFGTPPLPWSDLGSRFIDVTYAGV
jgi:hypothetical protein